MSEITHFAVATDTGGLLEILVIGRADPQSGQEVWLGRQLPSLADGTDQWQEKAWQSLGSPGGENQLDGIALAADVGGGLETVVLADTRTMWHARQDGADGKWSDWESLGNPASGSSLTPPTLVQNTDGRLELFTVSLRPRPEVWHRGQPHVGQNQWGGWSPIGFPRGQGELIVTAPSAALNEDGRLEVYLEAGGQIWHSWQKSPGATEWMPWQSLGQPEDVGPVGVPAAALDVDGRLQVVTNSGPNVWVRGQHEPGQSWDPWMSLSDVGVTGDVALAVGAQEGGRLVVFSLRTRPDGTQHLEKTEQQGGLDEFWIPGDPIKPVLLGKPGVVPVAANPALVMDGRNRLRLFLSVPGTEVIYGLVQANEAGEAWLDFWLNFPPP